MALPLPMALRERIVAAYKGGEETYEQLAARFRVGVASVNRYLRRARRRNLAPSAHGGGHAALIGALSTCANQAVTDRHTGGWLQVLSRRNFRTRGDFPCLKSTVTQRSFCRGVCVVAAIHEEIGNGIVEGCKSLQLSRLFESPHHFLAHTHWLV